MDIDEIKKELLSDRDFREKLFELYYKDDERFINKLMKKASKDEFDTLKS